MSRQSICSVLRASGTALHGRVAAARAPLAVSSTTSRSCCTSSSSSFTSSSSFSSSSSSSSSTCLATAARPRRSATPSSTLSQALLDARLLPSSCQGQVRLLSSTAPRTAAAITFTPSSEPEIDQLLAEIHEKVILPSYLNFDNRRKIYNSDYRETLRTNPITIEVGGEEHRFSYVDPMQELPNVRKLLSKIVSRMSTPADFANLPRLLEGFHRAGRHLRAGDYARMTRLAGERGCINVIIECARGVRRTGFRLDHSEVVAEILSHVQLKAVDSAWDEAQTRKALAWSEQVFDLLQSEHHGRRPFNPDTPGRIGAAMEGSTAYVAETPLAQQPTIPLARDPQLLAARLHLAAVVADKFSVSADGDGGVDDTDGKVSRYATELVQLWPAGKGLRALHPREAYTGRHSELMYLNDDNKFLGLAAPLLHGLDAAMRVLGGSQGDSAVLVGELQSRRDTLHAEVQAALANVPDRRGAAIYSKYFGEK